MTELEIIEGKKLIAKWLGYEIEPFSYLDDDNYVRYFVDDHIECIADGIDYWETCEDDWSSWLTPSQMKFDSSWNWLIPVIDKIYSSKKYIKYKNNLGQFSEGININTKYISVTFESVIEFIKWDNSQTEKN